MLGLVLRSGLLTVEMSCTMPSVSLCFALLVALAVTWDVTESHLRRSFSGLQSTELAVGKTIQFALRQQ